MVAPHCVHDPLGIPPGMPALLQSIPRAGARIPPHDWALEPAGSKRIRSTYTNNRANFIASPQTAPQRGIAWLPSVLAVMISQRSDKSMVFGAREEKILTSSSNRVQGFSLSS